MMRPLYFVLLLAAFAFLTFASAENVRSEFEAQAGKTNDLETDATAYWGGYGRPLGGYGWGGYGRTYPSFGRYPYYGGGWNRGYGRGWGGFYY